LQFNDGFVIDINEIIKVVSNLKDNKTGGVDGFNSSVLKRCVNGVAIPLYLIFKQSMSSSIIPLDWKSANITVIFKRGSKKDVNN